MSEENKTPEDLLIDKYVEIKGKEDGSPLILDLISKYFIPQNRFEEARSWRDAITNSEVKSKATEILKAAQSHAKASVITRLPQNKDWYLTSPQGESQTTEDQQYHYDRTIAYSNFSQSMLKYIDDVRECRNEWITFVAKNAFSGLEKFGAEFDTIAMALSDYIEFFLLPDKFLYFDAAEKKYVYGPAKKEVTPPATTPVAQPKPQFTTVEDAYNKRPEVIAYLKEHASGMLKDGFLLNFFCTTAAVSGKSEEIIVSQSFVAFVPEKKSGWGAGQFQILSRASISSISVGTEVHTEYQGLFSTTQSLWTLTFITKNYTQFTRWLYLGKNEAERNKNRPIHGKTLDKLSKVFQLVQGDSFQTSGGYRTSIGVGWWV